MATRTYATTLFLQAPAPPSPHNEVVRIIAYENSRTRAEGDRQTLVDAVADADREVDAVRNGSDEVEDTKESGVRARECELVSVNLEARFAERFDRRMQHLAVADRKP